MAKIDASGVNYIHPDHLGTPVLMTNATGEKVWEIESRPFGDAASINGTASLNLRFPGQYYDAETGLNQNGFRDYNVRLGRYSEVDPIGLAGDDVNIYRYVKNNPINLVDPDGLAGRGNGGDGSATGRGTNTQYKHCREYNPPDIRFIECKDKRTGQKKRVPRPDSWPFPNQDPGPQKSMCDNTCKNTIVLVGGVVIIVGACIVYPPLLIGAAAL